jgi:hypothetical protein
MAFSKLASAADVTLPVSKTETNNATLANMNFVTPFPPFFNYRAKIFAPHGITHERISANVRNVANERPVRRPPVAQRTFPSKTKRSLRST